MSYRKPLHKMATGAECKTTSKAPKKPMDKKYRNILESVRVELVRGMDAEQVLRHMAGVQVFSDANKDIIKSRPNRQEQCKALLDILPRRGENAYESFIQALEEVQPYLADVVRRAGKCYCGL